jgi:hypothetical protein
MSDLLGTTATSPDDPSIEGSGPHQFVTEIPTGSEGPLAAGTSDTTETVGPMGSSLGELGEPVGPAERRTLRKRRPPTRALAAPADGGVGGGGGVGVFPSGRTPEQFWASLAIPSVWAIVVAVLLGGSVAFLAANIERTKSPVYQSVSVLLFDNPAAIAANPASVLSIANDRGKYAGLVQTDAFAIPAAQRAGVTPGQIQAQVRAAVDQLSLNMDIVSQATDPILAQKLSLGAAEYMVDYVTAEQAALPSLTDAQLRLEVRIISNPRPGKLISPTHQKEITSGAIYGGIVLVVTYIIGQFVADRVRVRRRMAASRVHEPVG